MKKKYIAYIISILTAVSATPAFAAQTDSAATTSVSASATAESDETEALKSFNGLSSDSVLQVEKRSDAEALTLDKAYEMALKNSTALKKLANSTELNNDDLDDLGESYTYSTSDDNFSTLLSLIQTQVANKNNQLSETIQKASIKFSLEKAYVSIINSEREVALLKLSLKNDAQELTIANKKLNLGLISKQELDAQKLTYSKNVNSLSEKEKSIDEAYDSLNVLIGAKVGTKYQLYLEPEFSEAIVNGGIESYVTRSLSTNLNLQKDKNDLQLAKDKLDVYSAESAGTYQSVKNNISELGLSYEDSKKELETKIRTCYNNIKTLEQNIETSEAELIKLKADLEISKKKFELNLITELELDKAKLNVAQKESDIISSKYEHMLLVKQFENTNLL